MTKISLLEWLSAETCGMSYVRRLFFDDAVTIDGKIVNSDILVEPGTVVKIGKRQIFVVTI